MTGRPTIIDVARHAGVSKSTVSLVLQSSPAVRTKTADKVRDSIQALGYVYNRSAANLRSSGSGLIGLVINDLRNPFFTEFAATFQQAIFAHGYSTIVSDTAEDPEIQLRTVTAMIEHGVSGLIISPAYGNTDWCQQISRSLIPAIQVLRRATLGPNTLPFASFDYSSGSELAARHLFEAGCRRIAFVGGLPEREITRERMKGYLDVADEKGQLPYVWHGPSTRHFGRHIARALCREHSEIDGVVAFNDQVALGMLAGFMEAGRQVGHDIRLVGFDDIQECIVSWPMLSSVHCDIDRLARWASESLVDWIGNGLVPDTQYIVPVELRVRDSSCCVNSADCLPL